MTNTLMEAEASFGTTTDPGPRRASVIGMAVRLPGADTLADLWDLVLDGRTTFAKVSAAVSRSSGYSAVQMGDPRFVPMTSSLANPSLFDHEFFGIATHEARTMDPQHRLLMETVWGALEDAGHAGDYASMTVSLFASVSPSTYLTGPLTRAGLWDATDPNYGILLGNDKDFAATRTAFALGFTGPCMAIQTACSSSLVAVHAARQSLAAGECDLAVVAASSISLPHLGGYLYRQGSIFSPTGACRPFDAAADGTVKANGALALVLRRAFDAELHGDRRYADLVGSAVNNDGRRKAGFAAPGVDGQSSAIAAALQDAGLPAECVGYVEAHGTGTALGDPLEIRALSRAHADAASPCDLGSLKATMGHLDTAAGVAGLAKVALMAHHRVIPPLAGFEGPNPMLRLDSTRFEIPVTARAVPHLVGGVSSFGMGGTNAHILVESIPDAPAPAPA